VANHLNDIAKDHPDIVIKTCKAWLKKPNEDIKWVVKHATRTLVKAGNKDVFPLLGYTENPNVTLNNFALSTEEVLLGESISYEVTLSNQTKIAQNIVIDFAIYFMKANGKPQAKVFKCKNQKLAPNESVTVGKSFSFKPITTRKYYTGEHKLEILINGSPIASKSFSLQ